MADIQGIVHNSFIIQLEDLEIPNHKIQGLVGNLSLGTIKSLTYIVSNIYKLEKH